MFELFLLAGLVGLVIWLINVKPTDLFENPVILQEVGLYYATVSPRFVQSQGFMVQIATRFRPEDASDVATLCFEVQEAGLHYLMAISRRAGLLYFQVIGAEPADVSAQALRRFSEQVLVNYPLTPPVHEPSCLRYAVDSVACELKIDCVNLQ